MQEPTFNTLIPCREESLDFDGTHNLFIEAENLEALKILQKSYAGSVKMIYIDPPYNTGNDSFIYPDKFAETREQYARRVGDKDADGYLKQDGVFQGAFRKNAKDNGHFHSNWLNMMLPRLHLAKTLLADDGVIFISIDDNEQAQLKLLCDEVFGEENFVSSMIWKNKSGGASDVKGVACDTEIVLSYTKNNDFLNLNKDKELEVTTQYNHVDENGKRYSLDRLDKQSLGYQESLDFPIIGTDGKTYVVEHKNPAVKVARWRWGKNTVKERYNELVFKYPYVYTKNYEKEDGGTPRNLLVDERFGRTRTGKTEMSKLFDNIAYFSFPKPTKLISYLSSISTDKNSLILDFFSGSGTTAHAVMQLNAEDGGNRRYICVQMPEICEENSEATKAGFATIADIAKERIRRAGAKIQSENPDKNIDTGFKVFKLAESNFKQWQGKLKNIRHSDPERSEWEESQFFNETDSSPQATNGGAVTATALIKQGDCHDLTASSLAMTDSGSIPAHQTADNVETVGKNAHPTQADLLSALENHTDTLLSDNTENIFYELLLRFGLRPTAEIVQDNGVYCVKDKGACYVFVIQAQNADEVFFENILQKYQPLKVIVLEKVFNGKDDVKKNTALQIKDAKAMFVCV